MGKLWVILFKILLLIGAILLQHYGNFGIHLGPIFDKVWAVIINFLIAAIATNLSITVFIWFYRKSKKMPSSRSDNVVIGLQNVYYIILTGIILVSILAFFGLRPIDVFTSLSIVAAAIAIVSKDFIAEIISGFIITFSTELSIDDYVMIGDYKGKIIDLTLTKVALLNDDDDIVFIPASTAYTSEIINYTKKQIRRVSIEFEVPINAIKSVQELEADLIMVLSDYHPHIEKGSFNLKTVEIKKDHLILKFQYTLHKIDRELEREIRRKTVREVVLYVKGKGVNG